MSYAANITCKKKGCESHDVELHHLVPKFLTGSDKEGRRYLCVKHHKELHRLLGFKDKEWTLAWLERED